jgi:hypothetical protein
MNRFEIVMEETTVDVGFKPSLPGLGARATGLQGALHASLNADGKVDLSKPVRGDFSVSVDDFDLGNRLINFAATKWLGGDAGLAVQGRIDAFKPTGQDSFEAALAASLRRQEYALTTSGQLHGSAQEGIRITGLTKLHPRDVGVPVPRFGIPWVLVQLNIATRLVSPEL